MLISIDTPREVIEGIGRACNRCGHCCRYGSGVLIDDGLPRIAAFLRLTEEELKSRYLEEIEKFNTTLFRPRLIRNREGKHELPYGRCIFWSEKGGCTIHPVKPLQCRIVNCSIHGHDILKWFDLRFFVNPQDPESIRQYAVYLEFNDPLPGGRIEELIKDRERLERILSYEILARDRLVLK
ncbi:hypothetical protein COV22_00095 [Candidatus Woesearchaeota archaeon CG10_big_fil_rev_8_21_14_0_10_47_5]|nr:MAG: hypothetical protein COV22_00095 [Candidatus Woesearchaeota archaeon CG10_big_fil_rev_8_21_14_0_10_47_5]